MLLVWFARNPVHSLLMLGLHDDALLHQARRESKRLAVHYCGQVQRFPACNVADCLQAIMLSAGVSQHAGRDYIGQ